MYDRTTTFANSFRSVIAAVVRNPHSDGELLSRYASHRDEEAFAELVRRLGPSVWSVCCRLLGPTADAEDAFQATFLVLARKAASVQPSGKVAGWLYGVAQLAARKARATRSRRMARMQVLDELPDIATAMPTREPDDGATLHEELNRLPEKFRLPIVLCELRELTTAQAASELGWPVGTVASRLSRGRSMLTDRLVRRGITAASVAAMLGALGPTATAAVPKALALKTLSIATVQGVSCTATVLTLTTEVIRAMSTSKLSMICAGLVASAALTMYGGVAFESRSEAAGAPVPKREVAADPLDRVKLEGLLLMLKPEVIQKDLELSEGQLKAIETARSETKEKLEKEMNVVLQPLPAIPAGGAAPPPLPGAVAGIAITTSAGDGDFMAGPMAAFDKAALTILKPEQQRRLRQISLQVLGPRAMLDRRVIRTLELTAEQEDKIEAELPREHRFGQDPEKIAADTDKTMATMMKLLTPDQKAKWEKLIGKKLPTADLLKASPALNDALMELMPQGGAFGGMMVFPGVQAVPAAPAVPAPAAPPPAPAKPAAPPPA